MNAFYSPTKHIEVFEIRDNHLFIPYGLCDNNEEDDHITNSSSMNMHQQSKENTASPKHDSQLKTPSMNNPQIFETAQDDIVGDVQRIIEVHGKDNLCTVEVNDILSLMPLVSKCKDLDASLLSPMLFIMR